MRAAGALLLLVALAAVARADEATFYRATALEREGKPAEAVDMLRGLVERDAADLFADDSLLEMARIEEERLGQPLRAAETYERLARDSPRSRLAERARRRAESLRAAMGPGARYAAQVAEMNQVLLGFPTRPRAESIARMERLLAAQPDFPEAARATLWLGTTLEGEGRRAEALARYREVLRRWPDGEWAPRAARAEGDLLLAAGDLDGAERAYLAMGAEGQAALPRVATARRRARAEVVAWLVLAVLAAAALASIWKRAGGLGPLLRPPVEVLYLLPVAALLLAAAFTENAALTRAIAVTLGGGVAVAWLSGVALDTARPVGARRALAHALLSALAVLAVCVIAVQRSALWDFLLETLRFGPER